MKRRVVCLCMTVLLLVAAMPVRAMSTVAYVQLVHISKGAAFDVQTTVCYDSLEEAVENAVSGDVIEVFADVTVSAPVTIPADTELTIVSGTQREITAIFGQNAFEDTDPNAVTRTVRKGFDGTLFTVSENSRLTLGNLVLDGQSKGGVKGGLIYASSGSVLALVRGDAKSGVSLKNATLGNDSFGGAVYVEKNATVSVDAAVFSGNSATVGGDIYAEQMTDVTIGSGVTADFAYPEEVGVNISTLNLILTGEIGLTFHTVVPQAYRDGQFVLSSKTGDTVTLPIAQCATDTSGRYTATYPVDPVELAEPVTLTVYDRDGNPLATKEKSVEDYGKALLTDKNASDKDKEIIRALLNYGHFAQIECAAYNGWTVGTDYAAIPAYGTLTTQDAVFEPYRHTWTGRDAKIGEIGMQLDLGYRTGIVLYFPGDEPPAVTVNGIVKTAEECAVEGYRYKVFVADICALDLARSFTVTVNGTVTLTLSALSYAGLPAGENDPAGQDVQKALYEFYLAVNTEENQ